MALDPAARFPDHLEHLLGTDPAGLSWPQEFQVAGSDGMITAVYDPQNALLVFHEVRPRDFTGPVLRPCLDIGAVSGGACTRVLVFAPEGQAKRWQALGFLSEATIPGYWADGGAAGLWARTWGDRIPEGAAAELVGMPTNSGAHGIAPTLSGDWRCRVAAPDDAPELRAFLGEVFTGYPIPADPGSIAYALAGGGVHGRLILAPNGAIAAYASAEFQPGAGSVEITDCATAPAWRGRGLMTHLVQRLQQDLADIFAHAHAHALARVDRPAMQRIFARLGWKPRGRLVNHFRVGNRWVSARVWISDRRPAG